MKAYFYLFYYNFIGILAYPYEVLITVIQPIIEVGFLALFWNMIAKSSNSPIDLKSMIAYFIMVQFIAIWTLDPGSLNLVSMLGWRIKNGNISKNIIRPLKVLPSLLAEQRGYYAIDMIYSVVLFAVALKMIGSVTFSQILWFIAFCLLSFIITFSISILAASFAFITKEVSSIRHSVSHIIRILSGALVPLTFFPQHLREILKYSPFPSMVFGPVNTIQHSLPLSELLLNFKIALLWSIILFSLAVFIWNKNIKNYEATGI